VTDAPINHPSSRGDAFHGPEIAAACAGRLVRSSERPVRGGAVDSRRVGPGAAFFALPGQRTDGHEFLADAVRHGASALVVARPIADADLDALTALAPGGVSIVVVEDTLRALQAAASTWRGRFNPVVVGITGSVAKTSTKEAAATVLSVRWRVLRNEGNENNEVGLPLTLLRLDASHDVAVLEMGMFVPGEVAQLAALARPSIGVVTAVRGVHLERAGSVDAIERGKRELVEALPADGTAILNEDDPRVARMAGHTSARILRYGFVERADVSAEAVESAGPQGMRFVLRLPSGRHAVRLPVLGRHGVHNALAAAAVGFTLGLRPEEIARGLELGWAAPHRDQLRQIGAWQVLDDSYNASPDSMAAALDLLATLPGRRVAVLGEMLELGPDGPALHHAVGRHAATCAELLVAVGHGAEPIAEGALEAGMEASRIATATDRDEALRLLLATLAAGDMILVKGSRGAALDELIDALDGAAHAAKPVPA